MNKDLKYCKNTQPYTEDETKTINKIDKTGHIHWNNILYTINVILIWSLCVTVILIYNNLGYNAGFGYSSHFSILISKLKVDHMRYCKYNTLKFAEHICAF